MHPLDKFKYCPVCGSDRFAESDNKSKQCPKCGFRYYLNAVAAVAAFIVDTDNNRLLLCKRGKEPEKGTWDLPGGFVDPGESAEEAIAREISEELNLKTHNIRYLFSIPNEYYYSGFNVRTLDMFYMVEVGDLSGLMPNDDVEKVEFFPFNMVDISTIGLKSIKMAVGKFLATHVTKP